jgi:probable F420-dependent oxidoreductase
MKVRIGIGTVPPADRAGTPGLAELVAECEAHGVDSVWLSDLVSAGETVDPLVGLAYAAARSEHLKLGTGTLVLAGRNPAVVASQLAGLAALAPGRILPTFGLRPARHAERTHYGVPPGRRAAVFEESLQLVRALLSQPAVTFHGEFFHLDEASVAPLPSKPLDLWLTGQAPAAMRRAGRFADGWLGSQLTPSEAARCRAQIETAAAEAGREIEEDHYGVSLVVAPPGTGEHDIEGAVARAASRRPDLPDPDVLVSRGWNAARAELHRFVEAGMTKFVVRSAGPVRSRRDFLDQFSSELGPLQN